MFFSCTVETFETPTTSTRRKNNSFKDLRVRFLKGGLISSLAFFPFSGLRGGQAEQRKGKRERAPYNLGALISLEKKNRSDGEGVKKPKHIGEKN